MSSATASEAVLAVEGIHCASCVQLIEMQVGNLPGVERVDVGLATHRARVRWQGARSSLADIVGAIARAGYRAWPVAAGGSDAARTRERRAALWRLFVAGFSMMQVMMYATPAYLAGPGEMEPDIEQLLRIASFVLTVPVMFFSAGPLFAGAWRDLRHRRIGMDVPAVVGLTATFAASTWATFFAPALTLPTYFDSVSMFVFFLLGGRYLEMLARWRATGAIEELARMQPQRALLIDHDGALPREVEAATLGPGDRVLVAVGAAVPADGEVLEGRSLNDEALLTGESRAVAKAPGDGVTGGAINLVAPLTVRVTAAAGDSRLSHLVRMAEEAAASKPWITQLADRHAGHFLRAILLLAALSALVWMRIDPARALPTAIAVLIVTCPCALSLAAPIALSAVVGSLARQGVLIARGHALETLARATHFVFDKTGTLTTGRMRVEQVRCVGSMPSERMLAIAGRMESAATHPVARAIAMHAAPAAARAASLRLEALREVAGSGIEAGIDGVPMRIGRPEFAAGLHGHAVPADVAVLAGDSSLVALADPTGWQAFFVVGDGARAGARDLVDDLKAAGVAVAMASGDRPEAAVAIARELGIDTVRAALSPADKQAWVADLQDRGAVVAMVGDGINDAPVLPCAHVSIAMGSGAPLAQTRADMVLMSGRPQDLALARSLALRAVGVVRQNVAWAALYNAIAIPLAVTGVLTPWMAGIGMSASSLVVVLNSLRLAPRRRSADPAVAPGPTPEPEPA